MKLVILLMATLPLLAQSDDAAIRDLIARYVAAREQVDAKAVEGLFTEDADQLVSSGEWRKGRPDLVKGTMASSRANSGRRTVKVETVRLITSDTAIADGRYEIAGESEARRMWSTFVVRKTPQGWKIAAIRNMLPAPPAR
jgi:uncharacterized protein (TIGR02246 family)